MIKLINGDCLVAMKEIPGGSVDAIICDPPYGTVKGMVLKGQTSETTKWDEAIDHERMLSECNRVLRTNGAMILFSQDPYTAKLMTDTHGNLPFSYRMTWKKDHFASPLSANKAPVNYTEDICVFFKKHTKHDFEGFHPLRPYAEKVCDYIGKPKKQIFQEMGSQGMCHFMRHNSTQFSLCTKETYNKIIELYGIDQIDGFMEYRDLAEANAVYRSELIAKMTAASPKIFNLPEGQKFKSNVLEYKKDYTGLHPTQKPVALMEDLIKTYTNEGDTVIDFTMGSGSAGVAAANLSRNFIGIELDKGYFEIAQKRINDAVGVKDNL
ncbi:DNA methylase [Vibrio phage 1.131.O._10N.222.49.A8]|nr:DNA methylase [Vibrio phage 1.131.O._10N.222.49.A8]